MDKEEELYAAGVSDLRPPPDGCYGKFCTPKGWIIALKVIELFIYILTVAY